MNFFNPKAVAERYADGRPFFHPLIIKRAKEFLSLKELLPSALDIGCGTGLSTVALKDVAEMVIGIDASREMIASARKDAGIKYFVSTAENLPFGENEFDLITMSQVVHWLEREKFFSEARRVLKKKGWIIIYDNYFSGQMLANPEFHILYKETYLKKYPTPPRAWASFTADETEREGFRLLKRERIENTINFSLAELTSFLLTLTNVIAAVEGGRENIANVKLWLLKNFKPFFQDSTEHKFLFNAPVWFLQRAN